MAEMRARAGVVAYKLENIPGVAETLTADDVKIQCLDFSPTIEQESFKRDPLRATGGNVRARSGGRLMAYSMQIEMNGSGTRGVEPGWSDLLECSRFDKRVVTDDCVIYTPHPVDQGKTFTIKVFYLDGFSVEGKGCMAAAKWSGEAGQIPVMDVEIQGIFSAMTEESPPAYTNYDDVLPPIFVEAEFDLLEYHPGVQRYAVGNGDVVLRGATEGGTEQSIVFYNAFECQGGVLLLPLVRNGIPAGFTNGLRVTIYEDVPDAYGRPRRGDAITNGASVYLNPLAVPATDLHLTRFRFPGTLTLDEYTTYHLSLSGDYTPSDTNNVEMKTRSQATAARKRAYSDVVHAGTGADDLDVSGTPAADLALARYELVIVAEGAPDTFAYRVNAGAWSAPIDITGEAQALGATGVSVEFTGTDNHDEGDSWTFFVIPNYSASYEQLMILGPVVTPAAFTGIGDDDLAVSPVGADATLGTYQIEIDAEGDPDTFKWRVDAGAWVETVAITGAAQALGATGVSITFGGTDNHTLANGWEFDVEAGWSEVANVSPIAHIGKAVNRDVYISSMDFDLASELSRRTNVNSPEGRDKARITNRDPMITIDPEMELPSVRDFRGYKHNHLPLFAGWRFGNTDGNIVEFVCPYCQVVDEGSFEDRDNVLTQGLGLQVNSSNTVRDDDVIIIVR